MRPKVSVVVPIYGVEKYLKQCVDSLLAQTLKEIEIILVDDGSLDKCPQMVDAYAALDPRVVAVHQENGGYGRAVNHGIEVAQGEYIGILESDDWVEPDMYEKLYASAKANKTDITKGGFYQYNSFQEKDKQNKIWKHPHQDLFAAPASVFSIEEWPLLIAFHASVWSSIYASHFIKQQKMIESKAASYQDFPFMAEAVCRAKRITVVPEAFVHYRMEEGQNSSTIRRDERLILMATQSLNACQILKNYGKYQTLKEEFYFHAFLANYGFYKAILWKYKKAYFQELYKLFEPLTHDASFCYKYFTNQQRKIVKCWGEGRFIKSLCLVIRLRELRRAVISFRLSSKRCCLTLFGIPLFDKRRGMSLEK